MRRMTTLTILGGLLPLPLGLGLTSAPAQAAVTCDGRAPTIVVAPSTTYPVTPVQGTPSDDVILGTDGDDIILGNGGNDVICALAGRDEIQGGDGDDRLFGGIDGPYYPDDGYRGDVLVPGPGDDFVDLGDDPASADIAGVDRFAFYDTISYRDAPGPVEVDLTAGLATGQGRDTIVVPSFSGGIVGSDFDDILTGSDRADRIDGGGGDDLIESRAGKDDVLPDNRGRPWSAIPWESDLAAGDDTVRAGEGRDLVWTRIGIDRVAGGDGDDYLHHQGAAGRLVGGDGRDSLDAGPGVDLVGGNGRDELDSVVGRTRHLLEGGRDLDVLRLRAPENTHGPGRDWRVDRPHQRVLIDGRRILTYRTVEDLRFTVRGGHLTYVGASGPDRFFASPSVRIRAFGRGGRDVLVGGRLADLLDGGAGHDTLQGSGGRDRCVRGEQLTSCEMRR
jgi:Ca2+-binding RTX toxin-like protein